MKKACALLAVLILALVSYRPAAAQPASGEKPRPAADARPADSAARPAARKPAPGDKKEDPKKKKGEEGKTAPARPSGPEGARPAATPARPEPRPAARPRPRPRPRKIVKKKPRKARKARPEKKAAPKAPPIEEEEPTPAKKKSRRQWRIGFYASAALTVAMFAVGGVGLWKVNQLSKDKNRHLLEVFQNDPNAHWVHSGDVCNHPDRDAKTSNICKRGKGYSAMAGVGLAVGAVSLIGTLVTSYFGFFEKDKKKKKEKEKDKGKGKETSGMAGLDIGSGVTLTATPQISENGAGISLQLDF